MPHPSSLIRRFTPMKTLRLLISIFCLLPLIAAAAPLTAERAVNAAQESSNWLLHGRTYNEERFSPLDQINESNVKDLGIAWYFDTDYSRGLEATPIVVDGVMYSSGNWNVVYANDAATGALLWKYDPQVDKSRAVLACCDIVSRGVAVWEDKVFSATLDGYLIALDASNGKELWRTLTIDHRQPYTITG